MIPPQFTGLVAAPTVAVLSTTQPDGAPHAVPVWYDVDGSHIAINTATHTVKYRNLQHNGRAVLTFVDPADTDRYLALHLLLVDTSDDDVGLQHLNALAQRYMGVREYPYRRAGDRHVRLRFSITRTSHLG
jgi:PPOX class probable F420-dependent enzyme